MRWIGTVDGVVRTWTIKRLPDEDKWQSDLLEKMVGLPWQLRPTSSKPLELDVPPVRIELAPEEREIEDEPKVEQKRKGYIPRGIYVRRDVELKQFGFTPGCDGCDRARMGLSYRAHSSVCKARIMEELAKTEEGRKKVDRVRKKEEEFLVAFQEREERERASGQQDEKPGKRQRDEQAMRELDEILGPMSELAGQGGPVAGAASSSAPVEIFEESGVVGGEAEGMDVERTVRDEPQQSMEIGALHRLNDDAEFVEKVREASVAETAELMLDSEVEMRRLLLQVGAISRKQAYDFRGPSVVELFSPPRVTGYREGRGLSNGVALDLRTQDESGRPWDLSDGATRARAQNLIDVLDPDLLIGSPPCDPFSVLQSLNKDRADPVVMQQKLEEGKQHLEFCCDQYERRRQAKKYFVHEHLGGASSWKEPCVKRLEEQPDVYKVKGDMCEMGMELQDSDGTWGFAKKSTGYMTNSPCIAE